MPEIACLENLHEAFLRAAKGKAGKVSVRDFREHLDENLLNIQQKLLQGDYSFGRYHFFTIYDPKKRIICAASFPDRIVFHAMMRVCHPVFDNYQIHDSYASRIGKGTYKALERANLFASRYRWFAKIDACKYFDSIDHTILIKQLSRLFKDHQLLIYFRNLLDSYCTEKGRGLPIGNLTSQYFANHYLSVADHYLKEELHASGVVRYMDDVLLFADDKNVLKTWLKLYCEYLSSELQLQVHTPILNKCRYGIPFLGYVVYQDRLRLNRRSKLRFEENMSILAVKAFNNEISEREYSDRAACMFAFIDKADDKGFRHQMMRKRGVYLQEL